ncbi:SPOSA6832_04896 [Sporobolomyces salmonicolor]|uniref:SPOSA6832_04896-mRNA-1:cds n=1 Tax=Sporidiobolus salmonicolor TaxID=5005 RepID=A0A0D6ESS3_SPOSA|nr:SPOSA6832_04896 [Sporobolomyces salmonicolor]
MQHTYLLLKRLLALNRPKSTAPAHHFVFLAGNKVAVRDDSDRELPFMQERNFAWLSGGCDVPGSALTIAYEHPGGEEVDESRVQTRLWLPAVDEAEPWRAANADDASAPLHVLEQVMWCGLPPSPEDLAKHIQVTAIHQGWTLASLYPPKPSHRDLPTILHHLPFTQPPTSVAAQINAPQPTSEYLIKALHEARRNKTPKEVELMKKASEITAGAHKHLMTLVGQGEITDENAAEAEFVSYCRKRGAKHQAYTPIMAAGTSAGTLHYIANDRPFPTQPTLLLVDAGAEYENYAADVTRVIPVRLCSSSFAVLRLTFDPPPAPDRKRWQVHEGVQGDRGAGVRDARGASPPRMRPRLVLAHPLPLQAAFGIIKPGANWEDVQFLMYPFFRPFFVSPASARLTCSGRTRRHDVLIRGFLKLGLFTAGSLGASVSQDEVVEKIKASGLSSAFYPHGVVGGLPNGRSSDPLLKYLRLRVPLEEGFVVTVEPGCYFNEHLFAPFKNSEFVNHDLLGQYSYVGGVRIEDKYVSLGFAPEPPANGSSPFPPHPLNPASSSPRMASRTSRRAGCPKRSPRSRRSRLTDTLRRPRFVFSRSRSGSL